MVSQPAPAGDDRGAKLIARLLRDAGLEVIYTGPADRPDGVVETAIQEDADALALSIPSGDQVALVPHILELLRAGGAGDVRVIVAGAIPAREAGELERLGVTAVLKSGTAIEHVGTLLRCEGSRATPCP